jgi:DNA-directed RNA polymerase II subunit RPB2
MLHILIPCIEESSLIQDQKSALDYIGKKCLLSTGTTGSSTKEKRIKYAKEMLQREFLPHVSTGQDSSVNIRKSFFFGYMINQLLMTKLERRDPDDRDHYAKKRLDTAGVLLGGLFRVLFRRLTKDLNRKLQKVSENSIISH